MRRQEFIDEINCVSELTYFCWSQDGCDVCDDVYSDMGKDEFINTELLPRWVADHGWQVVRDILDHIPTGYDYYFYNDLYREFQGIDEADFEQFKMEALEWGDDNGVWDVDEDDEEYVEEIDPAADDETEEDDGESGCSIGELVWSSVEIVRDAAKKKEKEQAEREAAEHAEAKEAEALFGMLLCAV